MVGMLGHMSDIERARAVERVHEGLITVARRGTARVHRGGGLSRVDQSLLTYLRTNPGVRAIDIADHFQLNRSTVSRQLGSLAAAGLIEDAARAENPRRGQPLRISAAGERALTEPTDSLLDVVAGRMHGWPRHDVERFASLLEQYNAVGES